MAGHSPFISESSSQSFILPSDYSTLSNAISFWQKGTNQSFEKGIKD
jgi:hypothetical protein